MKLKSDQSGVESITKVHRLDQPFMASGKVSVQKGAFIFYDSSVADFVYFYSLLASEVSYKVGGSR